MTEQNNDVAEVRIDLPLPLDVAGTLMKVVGAVYPGTRVATNTAGMVLTIPLESRIPDGDVDAYLEGFEPEMLDPEIGQTMLTRTGISAPEWLANVVGGVAKIAIGEAPNYIEAPYRAADGIETYVLTVARSKGQTPHQLRLAAEERIERLEAKLKEMGVDPDTV